MTTTEHNRTLIEGIFADLARDNSRPFVDALAGAPYNNEYCFLYRLANGKIVEITEDFDTQLTCSVLAAVAP